MKHDQFPSLYRAADKASVSSQRNFTILMAINLILMLLAALLSIIRVQLPEAAVAIYIVSAFFLFVSFVITFVLKIKKFEDVWYQGRALAESIKTLTWRFISRAEGFESHLSDQDSKNKFLSHIEELINKFKPYTKSFDTKILALPNITEKMIEFRSHTFSDRKSNYRVNRIDNQKEWYADKAEFNRKKQNLWFVAILLSQFFAICSAIYLVKVPMSNWNFVGLFTSLASAGISWSQLKQHQDHKQAYITACIELQLISEKIKDIETEEAFARFVLDSENAISREHTLWLVQKRG